ncbi:PREDICTED: ADP-ribosylation factor-binding protein GGA3 [Nicrophorus vespilloides]|uniref:ADP-ribosylation factor-binding protein GGA3 n=1 Tax=Nicrophorus vespilloides TaxID=110193 RepID=A0ABM1MB15_NICVS|nr:PREDICTED: ADP-ribosylation factor-binding protein GGA3 [Nicrophorus vespilloides]
MDLVKVSLEALFLRATQSSTQHPDIEAVEAFCLLMNKEKEGCLIGIKLLSTKIHSRNEYEVLQALYIIDISMKKCGAMFQGEVGKFRFLNEMIKLVSPKYLGTQTPMSVKEKVLTMLYVWTINYPKETKIKEAYEMLRKQGVIREPPLYLDVYPQNICRNHNAFVDDEKSKLLKKLLQSRNPEDIQAANRLIKSMVKEDERNTEMKSKRFSELESVLNNVRLLNEMLDSYIPGTSSIDELDIINELHDSCQRMRQSIVKLASEAQNTEDITAILRANDELGQVFEKYEFLVAKGDVSVKLQAQKQKAILDLIENAAGIKISTLDLLQQSGHGEEATSSPAPPLIPVEKNNCSYSNVDVLCDIFTTPNDDGQSADDNILKPIAVNLLETSEEKPSNNKFKALEDLDEMSENLLKENLQSTARLGSNFNKLVDKIPMNLLVSKLGDDVSKRMSADLFNDELDLDSLLLSESHDSNNESNGDDNLVDISTGLSLGDSFECVASPETPPQKYEQPIKFCDINIDLKNVRPSTIEPLVVLDEKNGLTVTLHFAKDKPRDDVIVIIVSIANKNELPLTNVLFRAIVPKVCKVRLQSPSSVELPAFKPFLPAATITQVMLISNPEQVKISFKFIVSYSVEDETVTEMGEIESLPQT